LTQTHTKKKGAHTDANEVEDTFAAQATDKIDINWTGSELFGQIKTSTVQYMSKEMEN
jgi:hypothetical protein